MQAESHIISVYLYRYSKLYEEHREWSLQHHRLGDKMDRDEGDTRSDNQVICNIPIVGYEIVEQRERFTVYKIRVETPVRSWFVFRRYTDFERLNEKLHLSFRAIKLKLPPKRRFGNNFNPDFIAKRADGLQIFIKTILQQEDMRKCHAVQEFFCFNDPPGPFDSLEESRAYVQYLEERLEDKNSVVKNLTSQLEATKSQLQQARIQIRSLECTLQDERKHKPTHSTPAVLNSDSLTCPQIDSQLSDISDGYPPPKQKNRKSVSFAMSKAASEGNLMSLKNAKMFSNLKDQGTQFRHSISFGENSFLYSGFLNVESHCNVTNKMKERKRKHRTRKQRTRSGEQTTDSSINADSSIQNNTSESGNDKEKKKHKRDSGIIGDSCTPRSDSDS